MYRLGVVGLEINLDGNRQRRGFSHEHSPPDSMACAARHSPCAAANTVLIDALMCGVVDACTTSIHAIAIIFKPLCAEVQDEKNRAVSHVFPMPVTGTKFKLTEVQ